MSKQPPSSAPPPSEPRNYLAEAHDRLMQHWRDSGLTVNLVDSDSEEYVVTFPRRPRSTQKSPKGTKERSKQLYVLPDELERGEVDQERALRRLVCAADLHLLAGKMDAGRIKEFLANNPSAGLESLWGEIELGDLLWPIEDKRFLTYRIKSDDEGGSECGPWDADVYGFGGVWMARSVHYSPAFFLCRNSAINRCYDWAHEEIIREIDKPIRACQMPPATELVP